MMVRLPPYRKALLPQFRDPRALRGVTGVLRGLIDNIVNAFLQTTPAAAGVEGIMVD